MSSFAERCQALQDARGHLCVGIDPRTGEFPATYEASEGLEQWCLDLVEATAAHAAWFKPNLAFFLELGPAGIEALEATTASARKSGAKVVLDAKFGDIGSTAAAYARFVKEVVQADAVTLNPYLGLEAARPFLDLGLDAFVLARTTNPGASEVQDHVADAVVDLFAPAGVGFVAPGTDPVLLASVRRRAPQAPLLVPGVGAQGGDAASVRDAAAGAPFFVNVSRAIARAPGEFPTSASEAARALARTLRGDA